MICMNITIMQTDIQSQYQEALDRSCHRWPEVIHTVQTGNQGQSCISKDLVFLEWAYTHWSTSGIAWFLNVNRDTICNALLDYSIAEPQEAPFTSTSTGTSSDDSSDDLLDPEIPPPGHLLSTRHPYPLQDLCQVWLMENLTILFFTFALIIDVPVLVCLMACYSTASWSATTRTPFGVPKASQSPSILYRLHQLVINYPPYFSFLFSNAPLTSTTHLLIVISCWRAQAEPLWKAAGSMQLWPQTLPQAPHPATLTSPQGSPLPQALSKTPMTPKPT